MAKNKNEPGYEYDEAELKYLEFFKTDIKDRWEYSGGKLRLFLQKQNNNWFCILELNNHKSKISIDGGAPKSFEAIKQLREFIKGF